MEQILEELRSFEKNHRYWRPRQRELAAIRFYLQQAIWSSEAAMVGLKDVVNSEAQLHGWNQPAAVNVNIANIPMPTAEERAEMRALDDKLDAIAAKLRGSNGK